jgi:hypothetical protein
MFPLGSLGFNPFRPDPFLLKNFRCLLSKRWGPWTDKWKSGTYARPTLTLPKLKP